MKTKYIPVSLATLLFLASYSPAPAIEESGESGSPSATTTIEGKQLPAPNPKFGGEIKKGASVEALVGSAHRAAQAGTQRLADHHR